MDNVVAPTEETATTRIEFFKTLFGTEKGILACQAITKSGQSSNVAQAFFEYPSEVDNVNDWIETNHSSKNVYFSPMLYTEKRRTKATVKTCTCIWADFDGADWRQVKPEPSVIVRSSPGKYHMYWLLDMATDPIIASDLAKRVAYFYRHIGMDESGWDLSQLLRIPETYNLKYVGSDTPVTRLVHFEPDRKFSPADLRDAWPDIQKSVVTTVVPFPVALPDLRPTEIFEKYKNELSREVFELYRTEPVEDWSAPLWRLECDLLEAGLTREETFIVVRGARCNKYARDKRPQEHLWNEVCKAADSIAEVEKEFGDYINHDLPNTELLSSDERENVRHDTFIDRYAAWAQELTDADEAFHHLGGFIILSTLLSRSLRIRTNVEDWYTNIWGMVLADTTLARKSTAMNLTMRLISKVIPDAYLTSDGSPEGIAESLAPRPGVPSVLMRDEFAGMLLKMRNERGYQSDLMQFLTGMYDGRPYKRKLARGRDIDIKEPILIMFTGGIKNKVFEIADAETVNSGFFPRFIFALPHQNGTRKFKSLRPQGRDDSKEDELVGWLESLHSSYTDDSIIRLPDGSTLASPKLWFVNPTEETWDRYDKMIDDMLTIAKATDYDVVIEAIVERLGASILKCAALLAATDSNPPSSTDKNITMRLDHLLKAMEYGEHWLKNAIEVCVHVGFTVAERQVDKIFEYVKEHPGIRRGDVMRRFRLNAREADLVFDTMEQRGLLVRQRKTAKKEYMYVPGAARRTSD